MYVSYNSDFEVVKKYLEEKEPNAAWTARPGNNCVWVSKGRLEMYYFVKDGKVVDIVID